MLDQLYTVLMILVEGESFDILVGSGSGDGLGATPAQTMGPLTKGRVRGLLREIFSPGRAKLGELHGAVERLEDLMRRYTQRGDASEWPASHASRGHQNSGVGSTSPRRI